MGCVCITTYSGILDMRVGTTRPTIDKLVLMNPPACACAFNVFDNIRVRDAIVYLNTGFPEMFNQPDIWVNRIPRGGHREDYPGGTRELGFVRGEFLPNPPRYEDIGFVVPFIPPPPPQPAQPPQAPIPPPPQYECVSDNEADAIVYEAMNDAGVNDANAVVNAVVISDTESDDDDDDDEDDVHYVGYEVEDEVNDAAEEVNENGMIIVDNEVVIVDEEEEEEEEEKEDEGGMKEEEDVNYDAEDEADDDDDDNVVNVVNELSDCGEPYEYDADNDDDDDDDAMERYD